MPKPRPQLTTVNKGHFGLTVVPEADFSHRLQHLYLNSNQLRFLPESLGFLCPNLWQLFIFDNLLSTLPKSLGKLKALHELDAHSNLLTELPLSICGLKSLARIDLSRNRLSKTSSIEWVGKLRSLPRLPAHRKASLLPDAQAVAQGGLEAVRAHFEDLEAREPPPPQPKPRAPPQAPRVVAPLATSGASPETDAAVPARPLAAGPAAAAAAAATSSAPTAADGGGGGGPGGALAVPSADIRLGRAIAEGAFAEVFRGILWGQKVAVKRLMVERAGTAQDRETLRSELMHETRLLSLLSHPCIITLIGYTETPAQLVLEVMDGTIYDLAREIYNEGESSQALFGPLIDLLAGCAYLHARSPPLLHRDLKPPNVLHDAQRRCKLCDFGTCLELKPGAALPTEWVGSALYVAPEVDAEKPYGLPADVFSFGVLAYELYHLAGTGIDYYGEGDMFEGGGLMDGIDTIRTPLLATPPELPTRPDACENDAVWDLICSCMIAHEPQKRPTFSAVASGMADARLAATFNGKDDWL